MESESVVEVGSPLRVRKKELDDQTEVSAGVHLIKYLYFRIRCVYDGNGKGITPPPSPRAKNSFYA